MKIKIENMSEVVYLMDLGIFECPNKDEVNRKEKYSYSETKEFFLNKVVEKRTKRFSNTRKAKQPLSQRKAKQALRKNRLENRKTKSFSELKSSDELQSYNRFVGSILDIASDEIIERMLENQLTAKELHEDIAIELELIAQSYEEYDECMCALEILHKCRGTF